MIGAKTKPYSRTTLAPRKPFWKRKRWIAAAVLWLVIAYIASEGPVWYAVQRGWLPWRVQWAWPSHYIHEILPPPASNFYRRLTFVGWERPFEQEAQRRDEEARRRAMNPDNKPAWVPPLPPP